MANTAWTREAAQRQVFESGVLRDPVHDRGCPLTEEADIDPEPSTFEVSEFFFFGQQVREDRADRFFIQCVGQLAIARVIAMTAAGLCE